MHANISRLSETNLTIVSIFVNYNVTAVRIVSCSIPSHTLRRDVFREAKCLSGDDGGQASLFQKLAKFFPLCTMPESFWMSGTAHRHVGTSTFDLRSVFFFPTCNSHWSHNCVYREQSWAGMTSRLSRDCSNGSSNVVDFKIR
ncbi:hypothetical protein GQR58_013205 [Nymphon striatum]|nr:hypothetical protein GQR58_013205 [Nymphon striatum]